MSALDADARPGVAVPGHALAVASLDLARRFSDGATMWCWSPSWPQHARHVAVEFVHPVIMGKRALPAEVVSDPDPVTALRALVTAGDVVVVIAPVGPESRQVVTRARAWGATTLWIGFGPVPDRSQADHVIWLPEAGPEVAFTGGLVLCYHVLWELTHVCLEHSGLMTAEAAGDEAEVCITCADEGRLGEVLQILGDDRALVRSARGVEDVNLGLLDGAAPNDLVLIHAGVAIGRIDAGSGG